MFWTRGEWSVYFNKHQIFQIQRLKNYSLNSSTNIFFFFVKMVHDNSEFDQKVSKVWQKSVQSRNQTQVLLSNSSIMKFINHLSKNDWLSINNVILLHFNKNHLFNSIYQVERLKKVKRERGFFPSYHSITTQIFHCIIEVRIPLIYLCIEFQFLMVIVISFIF